MNMADLPDTDTPIPTLEVELQVRVGDTSIGYRQTLIKPGWKGVDAVEFARFAARKLLADVELELRQALTLELLATRN